MKPEAKVKYSIKEYLAGIKDVYRVPIITGGMGLRGTPDMLICFRGRFIAIEVKATAKSRVTPSQSRALEKIRTAGGLALVLHKDNWTTIKEYIY